MNNKDFYKRAGFFFLGMIIVLVAARFLLPEGRMNVDGSGNIESVPEGSVISWQEAGKYTGEYLIVEGKVVRSYNSGKACFLNFHPDYKRYFTAVIFASDFSKFPDRPEKHYLNKKVRVSGTIKEYNGAPEIILNSPEQIKIIK